MSNTSEGLEQAQLQVPRKIHQIYLSGDAPERLSRNVAEHVARNPGWKHNLYDAAAAEAFVQENYPPEVLRAYRRINSEYGAARSDLLRHLILYREGGVYLDIKSEIVRPLDEVLRPGDTYILSQWRNGPGAPEEGFGLHHDLSGVPGGEYHTHVIIAVSGHPFSRAAIDRILANIEAYRPWSAIGRTGVLRTTGPIAYTLAIHPLLKDTPHRLVQESEIGSRLSIVDYDHAATFKRHYSTLRTPVVDLPPAGRWASRAFVRLRELKALTSRDVVQDGRSEGPSRGGPPA